MVTKMTFFFILPSSSWSILKLVFDDLIHPSPRLYLGITGKMIRDG